MIKLNKNTQKAKKYIYNYKQSQNRGYLSEVYNSFSDAKCKALDYCENLKRKLNGYSQTIPTHNISVFTYAFLTEQDNKVNLVYITPSSDYIIEL